jgi:integrase
MAGRPPLRIGQHGNVKRVEVEPGVWVARCRYRDTDGVTRLVERRSPGADQHGKSAEDALMEALSSRRAPGMGDISLDSKVTELVVVHIDRLEEDDRSGATIETYRSAAGKLAKLIGGLRVGEATPPRIDAALRSMKTAHGAGMAKHARVILRGGLQLAVMAGTLGVNPARDVSPISQGRPKGAPPLSVEQFSGLLEKLAGSKYCLDYDLVGPITMLMATGLRRSELLGLRWSDYSPTLSEIAITGKVIRVKGKGLQRYTQTKTAAGERTLPLPRFATAMLAARRRTPYVGEQTMIFPSTAGTWRDPSNFGRDWRRVRDELALADVTSHSFRKSLATMIDDEGLSARIGADHLGHAKVSMTQDRYMARGRKHAEVADLLDRAAFISGG